MGQSFSSNKRIIEFQEYSRDQADLIRRQHEQIMKLKREISKLLVENDSDLNELENEVQALQQTQLISDKRRFVCLEKIKKLIESELVANEQPDRPIKSLSQSLNQGQPGASLQISKSGNLP